MGKITFQAAQSLPLDKLATSSANVRRINTGVSITDLAEDIGRRGLLQSLNVRAVLDEAGAATGRYAVVAGGRRLEALQLLVKAKRLAKNAPVPCIIRPEGEANQPCRRALHDAVANRGAPEEDSLAENTMREALHPLDQFRAFQALRDTHCLGDEEIAARFFVTPAVVRQRLRLATVSPKLLGVYAEDVMSLDQLMAFTVTADHARQEAVWEALSRGHGREAYAIRRMLTAGAVRSSDKRAVLVGLEAYEAAGGTLERDLFEADGGGYLRDVALLDRLVDEKLAREADALRQEGWLWVEALRDLPYGHASGLRRLRPETVPLSDEEQAERDRLTVEHEGLETRVCHERGHARGCGSAPERHRGAPYGTRQPAAELRRRTRSPVPAPSSASLTRAPCRWSAASCAPRTSRASRSRKPSPASRSRRWPTTEATPPPLRPATCR